MNHKILIIEDDPAIAALLMETAGTIGCEPVSAMSGDHGLAEALAQTFGLVVVDLNLPGLNGFEICKQLRAKNNISSILILTSRQEEVDRVLGLELGADDYVIKPFSIRELEARMKVLLRRFEQVSAAKRSEPENSWMTFGPLRVHLKRREARLDDAVLDLTTMEFEILSFLVIHAGEAVTREELMRGVWGYNCSQFDATITTHMSRLRKKLRSSGGIEFIDTIKGIGYRFCAEA